MSHATIHATLAARDVLTIPSPPWRSRSQQGRMMSRAASGFALVVSGSVLLGWQFDLPILRSILPGRAAMSPLTAVTFVLIATALWLETESSGGHRPIRWLARAAAS